MSMMKVLSPRAQSPVNGLFPPPNASVFNLRFNVRFWFLILNCVIIVILLRARSAPNPNELPSQSSFSSRISTAASSFWRAPVKAANNAIFNTTLGFQQIYAIALPDRQDRVIPLLEGGNATNINITIVDGVRDSNIPKDEYPRSWIGLHHHPGELGCVMSHVHTYQKMIRENISTALIMESDADWDLRIRIPLQEMPKAIDALLDFPFDTAYADSQQASRPSRFSSSRPDSEPYGMKWDLLWLGSCGSDNGGESRLYAWNDTTAPAQEEIFTYAPGLQDEQYTPGTRTMFSLHGGAATCGVAYAITLEGAKKMLKVLQDTNSNQDISMQQACSNGYDFNCLAIWPQLFTAVPSKTNIAHPWDVPWDVVDDPESKEESKEETEEEEDKPQRFQEQSENKEDVKEESSDEKEESDGKKEETPLEGQKEDDKKEEQQPEGHKEEEKKDGDTFDWSILKDDKLESSSSSDQGPIPEGKEQEPPSEEKKDEDSFDWAILKDKSSDASDHHDLTRRSVHPDALLASTLPPSGPSIQFSARQNAPLILHQGKSTLDLLPRSYRMWQFAMVDEWTEHEEQGSNGRQVVRNMTSVRRWTLGPLNRTVAFEGAGLPWVHTQTHS